MIIPIDSNKEIAKEVISDSDLYFCVAVKGNKQQIHTNMSTSHYLNIICAVVNHFCMARPLQQNN